MPSPRVPLLVASALGGGLLVPLWAPSALADPSLPAGCSQETVGGTVTCSFDYTGGEQVFTVPDGVTSVDLTAEGAPGASDYQGTAGGRGALVSGTFAVQPGDTLTVTVGGLSPNGPYGELGGYGYGRGGDAHSVEGDEVGRVGPVLGRPELRVGQPDLSPPRFVEPQRSGSLHLTGARGHRRRPGEHVTPLCHRQGSHALDLRARGPHDQPLRIDLRRLDRREQ